MVWKFLLDYKDNGELPSDMIDPNVRTDFNKLQFLVMVDNKLNGNFSVLEEILEEKEISSELKDNFSIGDTIDENGFVSLLFYLGLLTLKFNAGDFAVFQIPNLSIERLLWEYISEGIKKGYRSLRIDERRLMDSFYKMSYRGEWRGAIEYILDKFYEAISIRDFIFHEEGIKTFMLAYLNMSPFFYARSEVELSGGYADIVLYPIVRDLRYHYVIELKYIKSEELKRGNMEKLIESSIRRAEEQLRRYSKSLPQKLRMIVIIASSKEYLYLGEVE